MILIYPRDHSGDKPAFMSGYLAACEAYHDLPLGEIDRLLKECTAKCKNIQVKGRIDDERWRLQEGERAGLHDLYYSSVYMTKPLWMLRGDIRRLKTRRPGIRLKIAHWALRIRTGPRSNDLGGQIHERNGKQNCC